MINKYIVKSKRENNDNKSMKDCTVQYEVIIKRRCNL